MDNKDYVKLIIASWSDADREWQVSARASADDDWSTFEEAEGGLSELLALARDVATGG